jgi:class 3 adenylate cyclase
MDVVAMARLVLRLRQETFYLSYVMLSTQEVCRVPITFRFGLHTGELFCGVLTRKRFSYDLLGQAVNLAARMMQLSDPGRILCTDQFAALLEQCGGRFTDNGALDVKGFGLVHTKYLEFCP